MNFKINLSIFMKFFFLSFIIFSISILATPNQNVFAIFPEWNAVYNLEAGGVQDSIVSIPSVIVSVTDPAAAGLGTITTRITSSIDPVGFDLTLIEDTPGTFSNTNLALMSDTSSTVTMSSHLKIIVFDDSNELPDVQTLPFRDIIIVSDSDTDPGIFPTFTETGPNTNLYEATINFGAETNFDTNTLAAAPGDIFTVIDKKANNVNGFVLPNQKDGKGGILAVVGEAVTATYQGDSTSFVVSEYTKPGRGSGGLIRPGLVVDSSGNGNGGGCNNCQPPTLGVNKNFNRVVNGGFSYNDNPVDVELYYTPYPLITVDVGQNNLAVLKIFDDGGIEKIQHVSLAFGLSNGESFSESKATISLHRTFDGKEITDVYDPEHVLDNVEIITSTASCGPTVPEQCLVVSIHHMFRETLLFNMVGTNVWDFKKNSWQNFYNHGIEIKGNSLNPPKSMMVAFGEKNMRGLHELTQVDKKKDLWVDEYGSIYEHKGNDRFDRIMPISKEKDYDKINVHGCDRNCNWFNEYKLNEGLLAKFKLEEILEGKMIEGEPLKEAFSYEYKIISRAEDTELQKSKIIEIKKAEKIVDEILKFRHN